MFNLLAISDRVHKVINRIDGADGADGDDEAEREVQETMTPDEFTNMKKLLNAQASAEKAVELAEMRRLKRLYAAYVESELGIDEACEILKNNGSARRTGEKENAESKEKSGMQKNQKHGMKCTLSHVAIRRSICNRERSAPLPSL